jgi:hypothetical protein
MGLGQAVGQRDADRAHGNVNGIAAKRGKRAAVPEYDTLDRRVVSQHRDQRVSLACIGNAVGNLRALARQGFGLAARAIIDGKAMAGLQEVPRHRRAHVAKPDETDVHRFILSAERAITIAW